MATGLRAARGADRTRRRATTPGGDRSARGAAGGDPRRRDRGHGRRDLPARLSGVRTSVPGADPLPLRRPGRRLPSVRIRVQGRGLGIGPQLGAGRRVAQCARHQRQPLSDAWDTGRFGGPAARKRGPPADGRPTRTPAAARALQKTARAPRRFPSSRAWGRLRHARPLTPVAPQALALLQRLDHPCGVVGRTPARPSRPDLGTGASLPRTGRQELDPSGRKISASCIQCPILFAGFAGQLLMCGGSIQPMFPSSRR